VISSVLHDLPFSQNQPLKSADDYHIKILKINALDKIKTTKKIRACDLNYVSRRSCTYICVIINAV